MVKEAFRLCRMLPFECAEDFDYLVSCEDGVYGFSTDQKRAVLFDTWEDFVSAAEGIWKAFGPTDIMFERVYTMPGRTASNAG